MVQRIEQSMTAERCGPGIRRRQCGISQQFISPFGALSPDQNRTTATALKSPPSRLRPASMVR
jgi:hypothetical protein